MLSVCHIRRSVSQDEKIASVVYCAQEVIFVQQPQNEHLPSHSVEEDRPIGAAPTLHPGNLPSDEITARWLAALAFIAASDDDSLGLDNTDRIT